MFIRVLAKAQDHALRFGRQYWWFPLTVPGFGVPSLSLFIGTACTLHFRCLEDEVPTFSYAAERTPEYHIFSTTMTATSVLIATSSLLVSARMSMLLGRLHAAMVWQTGVALACLNGLCSAVGLAVLAVVRMDWYEATHISASYVFWFGQFFQYVLWMATLRRIKDDRSSAISRTWFKMQSVCCGVGSVLAVLFACSFAIVNKYWSPVWFPVTFTSNGETLLEYTVVTFQLGFMGGFAWFLRGDDGTRYDHLNRGFSSDDWNSGDESPIELFESAFAGGGGRAHHSDGV